MSRKYNRKRDVTMLASQVLAKVTSDPHWILSNFVKPKPKWLPTRIYAIIIKWIIRLPTTK